MIQLQKLQKDVLHRLVAPYTINGISAVVKELVHNSLDAKAKHITVKIHLLTMNVFVADNGNGISLADLELAGRKNYTSKAVDDLSKVETFGFRGETLFALSQVSRTSIVSKKNNCQSYKRVLFEEVEVFDATNQPPDNVFFIDPELLGNSWTVVLVRDLYLDSKIRRSELLSQKSGQVVGDIKRVIAEALLLSPEVSMDVIFFPEIHPPILVYPAPGNHYASTIRRIYGFESLAAYEAVDVRFQQYHIRGLVSKWQGSSSMNFIFINNRVFQLSSEESNELKKASGNRTYVLIISCPLEAGELTQDPSKILYNVHLWRTLKDMIMGLFRKLEVQDSPSRRSSPARSALISPIKDQRSTLLPRKQLQTYKKVTSLRLESHRVLKQLDCKYITFVANVLGQNRLFMVDQHACDERIRVETLLQEYLEQVKNKKVAQAVLDPPVPVNIPMHFLSKEHETQLAALGFDFTFNETNVLVRKAPDILYEKTHEAISFGLCRYLEDLAGKMKMSSIDQSHHWTSATRNLPDFIIDSLNTRACRSSITFGTQLNHSEMEYLLKCLFRCLQPFYCAHGRPSVIEVNASLHPY